MIVKGTATITFVVEVEADDITIELKLLVRGNDLERVTLKMENYIEITLANGYKIIVSKGDHVFIALENPNGFITSDKKLSDDEVEKLREVINMFDKHSWQ